MLCRFSKNLSADKISLSTLRGEGDLTDLELDETVLTDLLDLPSWLRLSKATCNRLTIKARLMSDPTDVTARAKQSQYAQKLTFFLLDYSHNE